MADVGSWLDRIPGLSRLWGGVSGPGGVASRLAENTLQTESFAAISSGIRGFFYGIAEFFKVLFNTNWSEALKDPTKAFSSSGEREKNGDSGTVSKIGGEVLDLGMKDPVGTAATVGVAGAGVYAGAKVAGATTRAIKGAFGKSAAQKAGIDVAKGMSQAAPTAAKSTGGILGRIKGALSKTRLGKFLKLGAVVTGVGVGAAAIDSNTSPAEAAPESTSQTAFQKAASIVDATTDVLPGVDVVKSAVKGDINGAVDNAAGLAGGLTGTFMAAAPAIAVGAKVGAVVGTFIPVPVVGTAAGYIAGGAVGLGGYLLGDTIGRGVTSLFNTKAEGSSPEQTPRAPAVTSRQEMEFVSP
ncbi:MAG: hypothetical protein MRY79_02400 [Alphaproteobacteria bacterium]|nr:hypothetical protein [Alphaproteobacteria bacterium]